MFLELHVWVNLHLLTKGLELSGKGKSSELIRSDRGPIPKKQLIWKIWGLRTLRKIVSSVLCCAVLLFLENQQNAYQTRKARLCCTVLIGRKNNWVKFPKYFPESLDGHQISNLGNQNSKVNESMFKKNSNTLIRTHRIEADPQNLNAVNFQRVKVRCQSGCRETLTHVVVHLVFSVLVCFVHKAKEFTCFHRSKTQRLSFRGPDSREFSELCALQGS